MVIITLKLRTRTSTYDLSEPADLRLFKTQITRAINEKNTALLAAAEKQLLAVEQTKTVTVQLSRIHLSALLSQPPVKPITDKRLFPRTEYYTRFQGTTIFEMNEPAYWETYHRSEKSRFFKAAGGRAHVTSQTPALKKPSKANSYAAHAGEYLNPFACQSYARVLTQDKRITRDAKNTLRDAQLLYKTQMAQCVVDSFTRHCPGNKQALSNRPIVYVENEYPCVLVALPCLNNKTLHEGHRKALQNLCLSTFVAILNVKAMKADIPIETVIRASFGHNLPSVCQTDHTFRINVGLIPTCYAELMGKALSQLNAWGNEIARLLSSRPPFDEAFHANVRRYNAKKLKEKICEKKHLLSLKKTRAYQKAENSLSAFKVLYEDFQAINDLQPVKGRVKFQAIDLTQKTCWEVLSLAGDSAGKSVLSECFRNHGASDWFADKLMNALLAGEQNPLQTAITKLLACLTYDDTVSMDYQKIHRELAFEKRKFTCYSFLPFYEKDPAFARMIQQLCEAFQTQVPAVNLYAELERAGTAFFTQHRASQKPGEEADFGSDSSFSDDLTDSEDLQEKHYIAHKKLRVNSGMKAILMAQYAALSYLVSQGVTAHGDTEVEQMYYEVRGALSYVHHKEVTLNKVRAGIGNCVLHFDLNHCHASQATSSISLAEKLKIVKPRVVILDYTSATTEKIVEATRACFSENATPLVLLVNSGLKHDQAGIDLNPYGQLHVLSRDKALTAEILGSIKQGLGHANQLPQKTHEMVRVAKNVGAALSMSGLFGRRPRMAAEKTCVDSTSAEYYGIKVNSA